jgi:CRP-like cAMP-binding protein
MSVSRHLIESLELFQGLTETEFKLLSHHLKVEERMLGDVLFSEGDLARSCLCLVEGEVSVYLQKNAGEEKIASLKPGASIGHLALIDRKRRSATCRVSSPKAVIAELTHETFDQLFSAQTSLAFRVMDNLVMDLVGHLRENNARLVTVSRERNQAKINRKLGGVRAALKEQRIDTGKIEIDALEADSVEVCMPSLDQRMRERRDK